MSKEMAQDIARTMLAMGKAARAAAAALACVDTAAKNMALLTAAESIEASSAVILSANKLDMEAAVKKGLSGSMLDRLLLNEDRIKAMADGLRAIAELDDPINDVIAEWDRPNGLRIQRVRVPLGVIGIIYESRPNVTADAGALCLKSGNAVILRGGTESFHSSKAIHACLQEGLRAAGLRRKR